MAPRDFDLADAQWLAHRYVETEDKVRFRWVERGRHARIPFLTDACLGPEGSLVDRPGERCLAELAPGPLHFMFHSAYCGSTMLVHALDCPGVSMGLSEPVILNDVVGLRRRAASPAQVARCADLALRLVGRPFATGEAVVVKPSNVINPLAELLLALQTGSRAIFLFAPLETFLLSVARKGLACRLWARELVEGYLTDGFLSAFGYAPSEMFRQSDLQIAALGWLAQMHHFTRLGEQIGAARLAFLDSETMIAHPARALRVVAGHYGLSLGEEAATSIASGPAFSRHSKSGKAYSPEARGRDYGVARRAYGEEIAAVTAWAGEVANGLGFAIHPPRTLLQS